MIHKASTNTKFNGVLDTLQTNHGPSNSVAGLYLHVPFCFHKCHYCDFYSIVDSPTDKHSELTTNSPDTDMRENPSTPPARETGFVDRMIDELNWWASQTPKQNQLQPRTIFVGGGTPTLLQPATWQRILRELERLGMLANVKEFTVEANPETVTEELMRVLVDGGVNRVSLGAQSFDETLLKTLERWHDPASVANAIRIVRDQGIANINIDLIFAIPGQTMSQLNTDLDRALALEPTHLSAYSLIYEPNTAMTERLKQGRFTPIDESLEREMFERVIERMADAGFEHYEISNWAKATKQGDNKSANRCEHNLIYWRSENWISVGPSASSHVNGHRWKNVPHIGRYLATRGEPPTEEHEHLPREASVGEHMMMHLRLREGVPIRWVDRNVEQGTPRSDEIQSLMHAGLLEKTDTHLRLTDRGLMVADAVVSKLL